MVEIMCRFSKKNDGERIQREQKEKILPLVLTVKLSYLEHGGEAVLFSALSWGHEVYIQGPDLFNRNQFLHVFVGKPQLRFLLNTIFPGFLRLLF